LNIEPQNTNSDLSTTSINELPIPSAKQFTRTSWWVLLAILITTAVIRYHLLDVPMERDEGEYAYAGQLLLQGVLPYEHIYNMKLPGIYAVYAVSIWLFGQTPAGVHLGLLLVNACTILLVFLLARRLFNPVVAVIAAASFATLSISQAVQGVYANSEHFVILPAVGGILLLLIALEKKYWAWFFASGLLLGTAFIIKQHGMVFIAAGIAIFLVHSLRERAKDDKSLYKDALFLGVGILVPFVVTCLVFAIAGSFDQFWFWTFEYARTYATQVSAKVAIDNFIIYTTKVFAVGWPLWILAIAGLKTPLWNNESRHNAKLVRLLALFSFLGIFPGFYFRAHYYVLLIPAVSILIGMAVYSLITIKRFQYFRKGGHGALLLVVGIAISVTLYQQRLYLFSLTPYAVTRSIYGINPFPEAIVVADYIKKNSTKDDRVAVIASEPEIYFYAQRRAATGYVYTYSLMEEHQYALKMQQQMIKEIEQAKPLFIVYLDPRMLPWSWLPLKNSPKELFYWFGKYRTDNYVRVGLVQFFSNGTTFDWDNDSQKNPRSHVWMEVLKRKSTNGVNIQQKNTGLPPELLIAPAPK